MSDKADSSLRLLGSLVLLGLLGCLIYAQSLIPAATDTSSSFVLGIFATAALIGLAVLAAGGFLGFLFGIPRRQPGTGGDGAGVSGGARYIGNTNLEEVSDWLTKIIVGVGLTQLVLLPDALGTLEVNLGMALSGGTDVSYAGAFGLALVLFYLVLGFLIAYIWTRLHFGAALSESELAAQVTRQIDEKLVEKNASQVAVMDLVDRQLSDRAPEVSTGELETAMRGTTADVRRAVWESASKVRSETWADDKPKMERTIPIFQALVSAGKDDEGSYRYHADLGYALKDRQIPAWAFAEDQLSLAIAKRGDEVGWEMYELNRAICRIRLGRADDLIMADLLAAAGQPQVRSLMRQIGPVTTWLSEHGESIDDPVPPVATVAVPEIVSLTEGAATALLQASGLVAEPTSGPHDAVPTGLIADQSPAPGELVEPGSSVSFTVSSGPASIRVPAVVELTTAEATAAIEAAGLVVGKQTDEASADVGPGKVIQQVPAAGTAVAPSSAVDLTISSGPA